ncbi:MAG TPA: DUF2807 domain-containing protein [Magnetospirillaceae bacterium]|nr:DUF2807 domain-containing protein [Magnetospirillaceae bacterium]
MMKTSHVMLICLGVAAVALTWGHGGRAKSTEKSWTVDGASLAIASPCAKSVSIEPSSELSNRVEVSATARRQSEIDQLEVAGGATAAIGAHGRKCAGGGPHISVNLFRLGIDSGPSLEITVKVPAGMAIDIKESKSSDYDIGAVGGVLTLDLSGSGDVSAEDAKDPVVRLSGSGDAQFDKVTGKLEGHLSGSGDLSIARADISSADLAASGSGDISVDEGDFASLSVRLSGSSDLSVGDGKIGSLTLISSGSSSLRVDAVVADADLSAGGSSDIAVHEVTGQVRQAHHGSATIKIGGER